MFCDEIEDPFFVSGGKFVLLGFLLVYFPGIFMKLAKTKLVNLRVVLFINCFKIVHVSDPKYLRVQKNLKLNT